MVFSTWLPTLALLALTPPIVKGQKFTCDKGEQGRKGAQCIKGQGPEYASAFCSSFLPITTPVETSTTTVTNTVTRNSTSFIDTTTETFSPPATTTSSETETFSSTVTETVYNSIVTGTITSFVDTETITTTSYSNVFTCAGDPALSSSSSSSALNSTSSPSPSVALNSTSISGTGSPPTLTFPTTSKNVTSGGGAHPTGTVIVGPPGSGTGNIGTGTGTGIIGTGTGTGIVGTGVSSSFVLSGSLPYYTWTRSSKTSSSSSSSSSSAVPPHYQSPDPSTSSSSTVPPYITATYGAYGKEKRQIFGQPRCLRKLDLTLGLAGISDACNCLAIATPTPSQTVKTVTDPSTTSTITNIVRATSTFTSTPTVTFTQSVNKTSLFTDYITFPTAVATTVPGTLTITRTSVSVITNPSPTPSTFNIYYTLNSTQPANFFQAGPAPGGSGIILANENQADFFSIDGMKRLVDVTVGGLFMAKNTQDLYPFALLQTAAEEGNTPVCEACGGKLSCGFMEGGRREESVFALCYGFLAVGPRIVFGQDADGNGDVDCKIIELMYK